MAREASMPMGTGRLSPGPKHRANWLLRGLILVSVAAHSVIFLHISGLYQSRALTTIELTMREPQKPEVRDIPRPRIRSKQPLPPSPVKAVRADHRPVPRLRPMKLAPMDPTAPASLVETLDTSENTVIAAPSMAAWNGPALAGIGSFGTARDYLDMVRLRIEGKKKYPAPARARQIEGRVTVRFTIGRNGGVREVKIARSSRFAMLDDAALRAVRTASPFPRPPGHLFQAEVPLEITILFELT